jgi:hypothetical protein
MHVKRITLTSKKTGGWVSQMLHMKHSNPERLHLQWKWIKRTKLTRSTLTRPLRRPLWILRITTTTVWMASIILITNAKDRHRRHRPRYITPHVTQHRYSHSLPLLLTLPRRIQLPA